MTRVIVVGVGGMGSAACYHLAKRGAQVIGLERFGVAHHRGSSTGESRLIRKAYFEHPDYVPLLRRSYELWDQLQSEWGHSLFHRTGVVIFGREDGTVVSGIRRSVKEHGLNVREFEPGETKEVHPFFAPVAGQMAVLEEDAGYLEVEHCVEAHVTLARRHGAEIRTDTSVKEWSAGPDGVRVVLEDEILDADHLILTPGAWAPGLLAWPELRLEARRVASFWFAPEDHQPTDLPSFAFDLPDGFYYGFPPRGGLMKVALHRPGALVEDPLYVDREMVAEDLEGMDRFLRACLPGLSPTPRRHEVCMYTMSPDEHFVLDHHPASARVVVGAGFSGHGFKFAPVVGEILADYVLKGRTELAAEFLRARSHGSRV